MNIPNSKTFVTAMLRQKMLILGTIVLFGVVAMASFKYVPKRFKVQTTLSIQTQYFQVPMIRDFLPETFDGGELRSQREGLLRRSLNHKYLLEMGKRHHLFSARNEDDIATYDLEELGKRFEIVPAGPTSFLISFYASNAEAGYSVIQDLIAHIRGTLASERHGTLLRLHDALEERLESLSFGTKADSSMMAARPDLVKKEISRTQEEIDMLKRTYSEKHPKIAELTKKLETLGKWVKNNPETDIKNHSMNFSAAKVDAGSKDLFGDLLKKYHYLEVAMYLDEQSQETFLSVLQEPFVPKSPIWPKRSIFLIWAVMTGFLVGAVLALLREIAPGKGRVLRNILTPPPTYQREMTN